MKVIGFLIIFFPLGVSSLYGSECLVELRKVGGNDNYNDSQMSPTVFARVKNEIPKDRLIDSINKAKRQGGEAYFFSNNGQWKRLSEFVDLNGEVWVKDREKFPNDRSLNDAVFLRSIERILSPEDVFVVYPRTEKASGSVVAIRRRSGSIDVGEVIQVDLSTNQVTIKKGATSPRGPKELTMDLKDLFNLNRELSRNSRDGTHISVEDPTSFPDGLRFPSRSEGGTNIVIDRKNDPRLKKFLEDSLPIVEKKSILFGSPNAAEKAKRAFNLVKGLLAYAHKDQRETDSRIDWYYAASEEARKEERARFGGDVIDLKTGVCKDNAILMTILLSDAGVNTRYALGTVAGSGHAWVEFEADGKWWAVDPTMGYPPILLTKMEKDRNWFSFKRGKTIVEFSRF